MSDLSATNCGCGCESNVGRGGECGCGFSNNNCLWIILLLFCCGGCGNGFGGGCGGNDSCLWIILLLFCCGGCGNGGCGGFDCGC
ncbi:MAG: chorion class high-cysteine HCB protein 13 [Dorea sp.]|nr:chorion class high-cysteine HCB protein 13 [Dorea sp.]MCI9454535.1 chorion class high-cysteine HCB protein 13 [Dorea sp.]